MTEQEISVKLTETEQRAKSNTHRIEKLEQQQKDLNKLVTAVEVLASREKGVETDVKEIKADVKTITQKGGKRWDAMIDRVLYVLIGAVLSLLMTGVSCSRAGSCFIRRMRALHWQSLRSRQVLWVRSHGSRRW